MEKKGYMDIIRWKYNYMSLLIGDGLVEEIHTFCCRLISKLADFVCSFLSAAFITAISDSLDFRTRAISILALKTKQNKSKNKKFTNKNRNK